MTLYYVDLKGKLIKVKNAIMLEEALEELIQKEINKKNNDLK